MKKNIIIIVSVVVGILLVALITGIIMYNVMFIGKKEAKEIALEHAGLKENEVKRLEVDFDHDDSHYEYTVEFIYDNKEYEYKLDAKTGEIIIFEIDR